ncbi:MAG TPA: RnfABCDGE type electron transport complex subunit B [Clostridia bacterium]|nr:RnfABCDGE type electron transport complex subunit B [Clostridia bacterium]
MLETALTSAAVMGAFGILFAIGLSYAAGKFKVDSDPRVELLASLLPGANCGGCGFSGCQGYAEALVAGQASLSGCNVCGSDAMEQMSQLLGQEVPEKTGRQVARIKCRGDYQLSRWVARYEGVQDCRAASLVGTSPKGCQEGCLGLGSCVKACSFQAMHMGADHLPVVDEDSCTGCGSCAKACPRGVVAMVSAESTVVVRCTSHDRGRAVRENCQVGCIGCKACEKVCQEEAIQVVEGLAIIDAKKCIGCGLCVAKCPSKCIEIPARSMEERILA